MSLTFVITLCFLLHMYFLFVLQKRMHAVCSSANMDNVSFKVLQIRVGKLVLNTEINTYMQKLLMKWFEDVYSTRNKTCRDIKKNSVKPVV